MKELTQKEFKKEVLESDIPVIVDFFASWCGPCQMMGPVFEKISKDFEGKLKFAKVSTEKEPEIAGEHDVRSIPCLIVFNKGQEVERMVGFEGEESMKQKIKGVMDKL